MFWDGKLEVVVWWGSSMLHEFLLCLWCSGEQRARNGGVPKKCMERWGALRPSAAGHAHVGFRG
jgi:hypothetical protein